jgi:organic hydroperoxide reductase OsmC/OhrA
MHPYPHTYAVAACAGATGYVEVDSPGLPAIRTSAPPQFDGPAGVWSPETLLCAAIADCFILTFRAVSRAARFEFINLECQVEGTLERAEHSCLVSNSLRGSRTLNVRVDVLAASESPALTGR